MSPDFPPESEIQNAQDTNWPKSQGWSRWGAAGLPATRNSWAARVLSCRPSYVWDTRENPESLILHDNLTFALITRISILPGSWCLNLPQSAPLGAHTSTVKTAHTRARPQFGTSHEPGTKQGALLII